MTIPSGRAARTDTRPLSGRPTSRGTFRPHQDEHGDAPCAHDRDNLLHLHHVLPASDVGKNRRGEVLDPEGEAVEAVAQEDIQLAGCRRARVDLHRELGAGDDCPGDLQAAK